MEFYSKWCDIAIVVIQLMALIGMLLYFVATYIEVRRYTREALKANMSEQEEDVQEEDASPEDSKEEELNLAEGIQKGDYRDEDGLMVVLEKSDSELYEIFTMKNDRGLSDSDFENFKRLYDFIVEQLCI